MSGQFPEQHMFEASVVIPEHAAASAARRVLAHPSGDTDILNYLGLETFA